MQSALQSGSVVAFEPMHLDYGTDDEKEFQNGLDNAAADRQERIENKIEDRDANIIIHGNGNHMKTSTHMNLGSSR